MTGMALNKLTFRLMPFMRIATNMPQMAKLCRRHYWPARRDTGWDPFAETQRSMDRMFRDFDSLFGRLSPWNALINRNEGFRCVPIETSKDGKRFYKIELSLPQFRPEDIKVTVNERLITVKAAHEWTADDGSKQSRQYQYQYSLPNEADVSLVRSLLTSEGLLTIEAPLPPLKEPDVHEIPIERNHKKE